MSQIADRTRYRVAQLRELASLGDWSARAGRRIGLSSVRVVQLARQFGIVFPAKPATVTPLRVAIAEGFAAGRTPKEIAAATGSKEHSVLVIACEMGLTRGRRTDPGRYKRGYDLPDHLRQKYRELRRLGLTMTECGYELGLLPRPGKLAA